MSLAYLAIKKVNGQYYAYVQESYRDGGQVRTRTVEYLGAISPGMASHLTAQRQQQSQTDDLVATVRKSIESKLEPSDAAEASVAAPASTVKDTQLTSSGSFITTAFKPKPQSRASDFFRWPDARFRYNALLKS